MSFIPVLEYLAGIFVFGFVKLIFNDVIDAVKIVGPTGDTYNLGFYIWAGLAVIYTIGGAIWLWKKYTRSQYEYWR